MLKAAIEKIQELCAPQLIKVDGHNYLADRSGCTEVKPELEMVENINLSSLDALVKFVKTEAIQRHDTVYITIPDHKTVQCLTSPNNDLRLNREYLYTAHATDVPGWSEKVTLSFEEALIALRTRFQPATDTEYALRLLSNITTGGKVTYNDNGVATSIVTRKGIDLQSNEAIKPIIKLRPYRTFQEVQQPESQFLIRINERGITFIEADGGMWKMEARNTVKKYLEESLKAEADAGRVVIVL
ncbi:MAG: hypothetical protein ACI3V4_04220 [Faecousia sp.]